MQYCLVQHQQCEDSPPLVVTRSLVIDQADKTWQVHIHNHKLEPSLIPSLTGIPAKLTPSSASLLLHQLSQLKTYIGNPDPDFISLGKEKKELSVPVIRGVGCCLFGSQCLCVCIRSMLSSHSPVFNLPPAFRRHSLLSLLSVSEQFAGTTLSFQKDRATIINKE